MAKTLGNGEPIAFEQRFGRKVLHRDLVEDGEIPGLRVHRADADPEHPQKRLRPIGPDQIALFRPQPEIVSHSVRYVVGERSYSTNLYDGIEYVPVSYGFTSGSGLVTIDNAFGFGDGGFGEYGFGLANPTGTIGYGDEGYGELGYGSSAEATTF